jgi:hypothetical protein
MVDGRLHQQCLNDGGHVSRVIDQAMPLSYLSAISPFKLCPQY